MLASESNNRLCLDMDKLILKFMRWNFPGGLVVKNHSSTAGDTGLIPGPGTKILHVVRSKK